MPDSRNATAPAITAAGDGVSVGRRFTVAGVTRSTPSGGRSAMP